LGLPSSAISVSSILHLLRGVMLPTASKISPVTAATAFCTALAAIALLSPSRSSTASCAPVEAPEGTAGAAYEPSSARHRPQSGSRRIEDFAADDIDDGGHGVLMLFEVARLLQDPPGRRRPPV